MARPSSCGSEQLHTRVLAGARDGDRDLCPEQVAAYVAKYSCKSNHEQITTRDTEPDCWRDRGVPEQLARMAYGVLRLSGRVGLRGLVGWMHMLGFRGHFVTKSRGYPTSWARPRRPRRLPRPTGRARPGRRRRGRGLDGGAVVLGVPGLRLPQPPATRFWRPASRSRCELPGRPCSTRAAAHDRLLLRRLPGSRGLT
jgi:hypothetical protein